MAYFLSYILSNLWALGRVNTLSSVEMNRCCLVLFSIPKPRGRLFVYENCLSQNLLPWNKTLNAILLPFLVHYL